MAIDSREPRTSASELAERLREHPELQAGIEEYLDVVDNCAGDVASTCTQPMRESVAPFRQPES